MNPADLQAMQATIAALGAAVVDMTKLCEGLPRFLETKIAAFRAELNAALSGNSEKLADMTGLLQTTQARQAELDGQVVLLGQTIQASIDATAAELRTITADNRAEIEASMQTQVNELNTAISTNRFAAKQQLDEAVTAVNARVDETRQACDTVDLHHAVKRIDAAIGDVDKGFETLRAADANLLESVTDINVRVQNQAESITDLHNTAETQVRNVQDLFGRAQKADARLDATTDSIRAISANVAALDEAHTTHTEAHVTLAGRVDEVARTNQEGRESLEKLVVTIDTESKASREDLQQRILATAQVIEQNVGEQVTTLRADIGTVRGEVFTVTGNITERIDNEVTTLSETIEGTAGRVSSLEKTVGDVDTRVNEHTVRLAAADETMTGAHNQIWANIKVLNDETVARFDKVDQRLDGHGAFHKAAHKRTDELEERVSGVVVTLGTVTESVNLVREDFQRADKAMGDGIGERFEKVDGFLVSFEGSVTDMDERITSVTESVASFGVSLGNIAEEVKNLDAATAERFSKAANDANDFFSNGFAKIEGTLAAHNEAATGLEVRIGEVEERVAGVDVVVMNITDEVRTLRTTTDTAIDTAKAGVMLEVKAANDSVAAVSGEVAKLAGTLAEVDERIMQVDVKASATVGEISLVRSEVREGFQQVRSAVQGDVKAANDSLASINEQVSGVIGAVDEVRERVSQVGIQTSTVSEELAVFRSEVHQDFAAVREAVVKDIGSVTESINGVNTEVTKLAGTVGEVANRVSETVVTVSNVAEDVRSAREHFSNEVGGLRTELGQNMATVNDNFKGVGERVDKLYEDVGTQYITLEAKYNGITDDLSGAIAASEAKTLSKVEEGDGRLRAELHTAVEAMAPLAEVRNLDDSVNQRLASVAVHIGEVATAAAPVAALQELQERVASIGTTPPPEMTPEQMAELQTRVLAAMPEPAPSQLRAELPDLSLDTEYEDGALVVRLNYGEGKVASTKVPVELGVRYRGVYKPGDKYAAGDFVSHKGSMWIGKSVPTGAPGEDFTGWQLAVKRGADGKSPDPIRTYTEHKKGNVYRESDFLRANNRLWQCAVKETKAVPDASEITSTQEWILIGGVQ